MVELKEKAVTAVKRSREDISFFLNEILGVDPDDWQREVLEAVAGGKNVSVRSGHGVGKTCTLSWAISWFMFVYPNATVPCTGPTEKTLKDVLWPELKKWWKDSPLEKMGYRWTKTKFYHEEKPDNWKALIRTSSNSQNIAGFHADHLLYVVEEASVVDDDVFEVLEGALSEGGSVVMVGNPTRLAGEFYRSFNQNSQFYKKFHVNAEKSSRVSEQWVQRMGEKWGEGSNIYKVRVEGLFPSGTSASYIPISLIEDAKARSLEPVGPLQFGVDVARYGDDDTVITTRQGPKVLDIDSYSKKNTQETAGIVLRKVMQWMEQQSKNSTIVRVDETGIGAGVVDRLEEEVENKSKEITIHGVKFNENPTEEEQDQFKGAVDEMFDKIRRRGEDGDLDLPADNDRITSHLAGRKYRELGSGRIQMERKDKFKERVGESPDEGDSVLLSFYDVPIDPDDGLPDPTW